jgi:hypothetical protein
MSKKPKKGLKDLDKIKILSKAEKEQEQSFKVPFRDKDAEPGVSKGKAPYSIISLIILVNLTVYDNRR